MEYFNNKEAEGRQNVVIIVYIEHTSHFFLLFLLLTLKS